MTTAPTKQGRVRLFGRFALQTGTGAAVEISSRRGRALIGYLALAKDRGAGRERLCALLWGDRGETQARASLRQCLLETREALAAAALDLLDIDREWVRLKPGALVSDIDEMNQAFAERDAVGAAAVLELIGAAPLLEGLELRGPFEAWLEQSRARFARELSSGVKALLEALELAGEWPAARRLAEAFLRREPLEEAVVAAALRADAVTGAVNETAATGHGRLDVLRAALASEVGDAKIEGATRLGDAAGPPLVVVAAFEAGPGESAAPLAGSLRDEIISGLSRFRDLRVVADPAPLDNARRAGSRAGLFELGARLRPAPRGYSLNVQLRRAENGAVIWSEPFPVPEAGFVAAVDQVIARAVGVVLPTIHADLLRRPSNLPSDRLHQRYLVAREAAARPRGHAAARAAAAELEAIIADHPDFALPYLPLAALYNTDFACTLAGASGATERARSLDLAKTALALDRGLANAYTATGWSYLRRRQWRPARLHFDQALRLNPFHATRVMEVGYGLVFLGDNDQAQNLLDRCLLLNPAPQDGFFSDLGLLAMVRGDHALAGSYFDLIAEADTWARLYVAINAYLGGERDTRQAVAEVARARVAAIWPAETPMTAAAVLSWIAGHHPFADEATEARFLGGAGAMISDSWRLG